MDEMDWHPLEAHWVRYYEQLLNANRNGFLDDPDLADKHSYPYELTLQVEEMDELGSFAQKRTKELFQVFKMFGLSEKAVASYLMNSVLVGMLWERERIGR